MPNTFILAILLASTVLGLYAEPILSHPLFSLEALDSDNSDKLITGSLFGQPSDNSSDLAYINNLLGKSNFFGNWISLSGSLADELVNYEGYLYMHYESDVDFAFGFEVFDGQYMDQRVLTILYDNPPNVVKSYDPINATIEFAASSVDYQIGETYGELGSISSCSLITTLYLIDTETGLPFVITGNQTSDLDRLGIQFVIDGNQCSLSFITTILTNVNPLFESQGFPYFITVLLSGIVQCIICYLLEKAIMRREGYARRISPWSLLILNSFDLYFLLATAYFFMSYSPIYELAAIPYAFLAFLYEPKLIWKIFRIHGRRLDDRRRSRLEIQSYFGMLLLFLCLLVSLVVYPNFVYLLVAIFLLPQIKHNFNFSQKHRWNLWITFGLGTPKLLFTIYSKLDPDNLLRITPDPVIVFCFIGVVIIQLILLSLQIKKPRFGFDEKADYKIYISKRSVKSSQELCSICLERLKSSNASATQSFLDNKKAKMMILTACKHEFHLICLKEWLKSKLECPYCRSELPALADDDDGDY